MFGNQLKDQAETAIINVFFGLAFVPPIAAATYSAIETAILTHTVSLR